MTPSRGGLQRELQSLLDGATSAAMASAPGQGGVVDGAPGAVALVAHRGEVLAQAQAGWALAFGADGAPLSQPEREPVTTEHVWDVASVTKLLTALTALVLVDEGALDLDRPVARDLPELDTGDPDRLRIAPRHLLTHTSGLPSVLPLWRMTDPTAPRAERAAHLLTTPLEAAPGVRHEYSCVGYLLLGLLLEHLTGRDLPALMASAVLDPLGLTGTGYTPAPGHPVAATEYQDDPPRGLVRGQVHDETSWTLGGGGNAGIFSTAPDLLRVAEEVRTGGSGLLRESTRALLRTGVLPAAQADRIGFDQAVGFRLGQDSLMATTDRTVLGHGGFTGTAVVIDPARELVTVLLTNRVHPRRERFDVTRLRRELVLLARRAA